MASKGWKKHFEVHQFFFEHEDPHRFVRGPWRRENAGIHVWFLIFRVVMSALFLAGLFWNITVMTEIGGKWLIFLTHQGYMLCVIQSLLGTIIVARVYARERASKQGMLDSELSKIGQMPMLHKAYWLFFVMAVPIAIFITVFYWALLYKRVEVPNPSLNCWVHGMNSVLCLIDLIVGGPPSRIVHAIYPIIYGLMYAIFNIVYWAAGGTDPNGNHWIYPVMDWGEGTTLSIILVFASAVCLIFVHFLIWILSNMRDLWARRIIRRSVNPMPPPSLSASHFNKAFVVDDI